MMVDTNNVEDESPSHAWRQMAERWATMILETAESARDVIPRIDQGELPALISSDWRKLREQLNSFCSAPLGVPPRRLRRPLAEVICCHINKI